MLAEAGADFSHVYNDYKEKKEESKDEARLNDGSTYMGTILIN
jgi:hypothetical protein